MCKEAYIIEVEDNTEEPEFLDPKDFENELGTSIDGIGEDKGDE